MTDAELSLDKGERIVVRCGDVSTCLIYRDDGTITFASTKDIRRQDDLQVVIEPSGKITAKLLEIEEPPQQRSVELKPPTPDLPHSGGGY